MENRGENVKKKGKNNVSECFILYRVNCLTESINVLSQQCIWIFDENALYGPLPLTIHNHQISDAY